jgi:hypothetical protein
MVSCGWICADVCLEVNISTTARLSCIIHVILRGLAYVFEPSAEVLATLPTAVTHLFTLVEKCRQVNAVVGC